MAEIQIIYREEYCEMMNSNHCTQCHTACASDLGCNMFDEGKHEKNVIPFGDCIYAKFKLEEFQDTYNFHLNCMMLTTRNKIYECEKVIIDGKCIYNEYDDDLISRQEVLNKLNKLDQQELYLPCHFKEFVLDEARVFHRKQGQTIVKHGKWEHGRCTECGISLEDIFSGEFYYDYEEVKFCPSCGAKMESEE